MIRTLVRLSVAASILLLVAELKAFQSGPTFRLDDVVAQADVIVLGTITTERDLGSGTVVVPGRPRPMEGRIIGATISVLQWIKGSQGGSVLSLRYVRATVPEPAWPDKKQSLLFLRSIGDHVEFADVMRPTVVAKAAPEAGPSLERVAAAIAGMISPQSAVEHGYPPGAGIQRAVIQGAVSRLSEISTESARRAMTGVLRSADRYLQIYTAGLLIHRGDRVALEFVANALEQVDGLTADESGLLRMQLGGSWIDEAGYPAVRRLLRSDRLANRLAAIRALGNNPSPSAIPIVAEALSDADTEVRWQAIIQLARITGSRVVVAKDAPRDKFEAAELHWKNWVRERGLGR